MSEEEVGMDSDNELFLPASQMIENESGQEAEASQGASKEAGQAAPGPETSQGKGKGKKAKETTKKKDDPCIYCGKNCVKGCVQCAVCSLWSHMSCTGLSKEAIRGLEVQAKEVGQAYWACRACMNFSNKWHSQMREVNKRQEETEARVEANTDKIEEVRLNTEELRREFREYVQRTEGIQERLEAVMDAELREREARRLNLVIHGLQEPAENIKDSRGRMEQDKIECERLFIAMKARTRYQAIRFCRRIGERGEDPRPLVFGVFTEEEKRHLLEKAKELVYTKYEDVTVVPDMTKSQRKGEQQLRDEANKRNTQLTEEDRSKNLRWLVVGKRGEKRLIKGTERENQRGRQERERGAEATGGGWNPQIRVNTGPNRLLDRGQNSHWNNDRRSGGQSWRPEHSNNFANSNTTNGNGGPGNGGHNNGGLAGSYNNRYNSNGGPNNTGPNNTSNSNSVRLGSGINNTYTGNNGGFNNYNDSGNGSNNRGGNGGAPGFGSSNYTGNNGGSNNFNDYSNGSNNRGGNGFGNSSNIPSTNNNGFGGTHGGAGGLQGGGLRPTELGARIRDGGAWAQNPENTYNGELDRQVRQTGNYQEVEVRHQGPTVLQPRPPLQRDGDQSHAEQRPRLASNKRLRSYDRETEEESQLSSRNRRC